MWFDLPLPVNLVLFGLAAAGVWLAGSRLARYADVISDRRKLGKAIMGLVFLATVTELPEIVTTFSAAISGNASLVLGNMFGGITMQTALLGVADVAIVRGVLTNYPRKATHALEAALLIILLQMLVFVCLAGEPFAIGGVGVGTILLAVVYAASISLLRKYDEQEDWVPVDLPDAGVDVPGRLAVYEKLASQSLAELSARSAGAAVTILICGIILVQSAEAIAAQSGLGDSFIGVTVLAAATSLPELSTTISAVRLGAYTLAISNIFGSNLIMLVLLFPADILYREGPILDAAGTPELLALISGTLVTAVYVAGLLIRRKPAIFGMGADSIVVLGLYVASITTLYLLR